MFSWHPPAEFSSAACPGARIVVGKNADHGRLPGGRTSQTERTRSTSGDSGAIARNGQPPAVQPLRAWLGRGRWLASHGALVRARRAEIAGRAPRAGRARARVVRRVARRALREAAKSLLPR